MDYETFTNDLCRWIADRVPESEVSVQTVLRNNDLRRDALLIRRRGVKMTPMIYLEDYYRLLGAGNSLEDIAEAIIDLYYEQSHVPAQVDLSFLEEWERASHYVVRRVVNQERNRERVVEAPHRDFLDLSVIYYAVMQDGPDSIGGTMVLNGYLEQWHISQEELDNVAARNTFHVFTPAFVPMKEMLESFCGETGEYGPDNIAMTMADCSGLYVLTDRIKCFGSVWMSDNSVLRRIGLKLEQDYYLLPSSVHECLILPADTSLSADDLRKIVREVNQTQVKPDEFLSDNVYYFSREDNQLTVA